MIASVLASGKTNVFSQGIEYGGACVDSERFISTVNAERDIDR